MRMITSLFLAIFFIAAAANDGRKANEAYNNGEYEKAVALYRQAIEQNPEEPRLHFNLGNSLYKLGRIEEAQEAYERYKSLAGTREDRSMADYNVGRMMIDREQYEEASNYFREALKNNPSDADARHNYELALRRQQEQEQQQQQQPESGDNEEDQEQDGEQQQQQNDQPEGEQESGQQPQPPQNQEGGEDGNNEQQPQPQSISPEEAENILEALAQLERELLENQKKEASETSSNNEKDW